MRKKKMSKSVKIAFSENVTFEKSEISFLVTLFKDSV